MSQDDQSSMHGFQGHSPEQVDAFTTKVISALRDRKTVGTEGVRQFVLEHLVRAVLMRGEFDPVGVLEELRDHRLTYDAIIDLYVPDAARALGVAWIEDDVSFADVTIGTLRLQSVLSEAAAESQAFLATVETRLGTLIIVPQGEQHFLGVSVLTAQLRGMGCKVAVSFDEEPKFLGARLIVESPDLVLITCSRAETLASVCETVHIVRATLPAGPVIALGGAMEAEKTTIMEKTGVDIVTSVAREAVEFCAKRGKVQRHP